MTKKKPKNEIVTADRPDNNDGRSYEQLLTTVVLLLEEGRRVSARSVQAIMTATYWQVGRYIVEYEQGGRDRAKYGGRLIENLSAELTKRFGRGFGLVNLNQMRKFYQLWAAAAAVLVGPDRRAIGVASKNASNSSDASEELKIAQQMGRFPLSWSHYVRLMSVKSPDARHFYEMEALKGSWSVRQLDRQISTLFFERQALSKNKASLTNKEQKDLAAHSVMAEEEIKDPFVLEFLGLKDEYSESALEEALIAHLEEFLLEMGRDFAFVARQKRLRIGDEWYRIDLLFFHRGLRCLVVIDLKLGKFTHADAGQMNLYLNYAREHWMHAHENPPVGLILCAEGNEAVAHYALGNLGNKVLSREYKLTLPDEKWLVDELRKTQHLLKARSATLSD